MATQKSSSFQLLETILSYSKVLRRSKQFCNTPYFRRHIWKSKTTKQLRANINYFFRVETNFLRRIRPFPLSWGVRAGFLIGNIYFQSTKSCKYWQYPSWRQILFLRYRADRVCSPPIYSCLLSNINIHASMKKMRYSRQKYIKQNIRR